MALFRAFLDTHRLFSRRAGMALPMAAGCLSAAVYAGDYQARLDESKWNLEPSPVECKLWQAVPNFGEAVFSTRAGEKLEFYLKSNQPVYTKGTAYLSVVAPAWHNGVRSSALGETDIEPGNRPVVVKENIAYQFLTELQAGMFPSIAMRGAGASQEIQVAVSAVNFKNAYQGYLSCLGSLFPANFEQLKASLLQYQYGQWRVEGTSMERMDLLAEFLALDSSVKKVVVDAHADDGRRKSVNWELSRLRGNAVREYLISKGVAPEKILMRFWGKSRPVLKAKKGTSLAKNRRVLVQLLKG